MSRLSSDQLHRLYAAMGITASDLPVSRLPVSEWTEEQLDRAHDLAQACRTIYGIEVARQVWPKLGLQLPDPDLLDPIPGEQLRH